MLIMPYADVLAIPVGERIFGFMATLVAIERTGDLFRCFYVSADNQLHAERLLRGAFLRSGIFNGTSCPKMLDEPCTLGPMKLWNGK